MFDRQEPQMRTISDTIARLAALRTGEPVGQVTLESRLHRLERFGPNPGALQGYMYIPSSLAENAALVVVLHGCGQNAAAYDLGSGWSKMADRYGFALLFPEQVQQNNPNLCFNWFSSADNRRDEGEALSIRNMIAAMAASNPIDPTQVFVTGLSAGGAMASILLATYPEVLAGGAIIAGLPYGVANTMPQAFDRMRGHGTPASSQLATMVREASTHQGPWPIVSIWHGTADATVSPSNAEAIRSQWSNVHGTCDAPDFTETVDGQTRKAWCDSDGRVMVEQFIIAGMGHGTPIRTTSADACGKSGAFMLEAGISSTQHICHFWGIDRQPHDAASAARKSMTQDQGPVSAKSAMIPYNPHLTRETARPDANHGTTSNYTSEVRNIIEEALRSAGLLNR
jgi:poly(hydroxyalkanoate) depolymerase family esterase